jgi:chemotaxis regulatin CheY-phosphate phosphatase CheZ
MKQGKLDGVLQKIEELRALMIFISRTLPFMEDVFTFVREIVPLLEVLKSSVESTSEKLPKASLQLNKVTTATELATSEILTIVEGIANRTDTMRATMDGRKAAVQKILETLDTLPASARADEAFATVRSGIQDLTQAESQYAELESIQNDCTNIMIALQVQDITAQQIASVNDLMKSVDEGLSKLMRNFQRSSKHDAQRYKHQKLDIVFDTAAEYTQGGERQRIADAVIEETKKSRSAPSTKARRSRRK